jgi:hypothetical protein
VGKMRFSLKILKQAYGLETKCAIQSIIANIQPRTQTYGPYGMKCVRGLYFNQPSNSSYFLVLELF